MQNYRLWYDRGLSCGEDWLVPIEEKIDACSVFLALMTEEYFSSPACIDEFTRAYHNGKTILPVILPEENKNKLMKLISGEKDRKAGANIVGYLIATKRMNCFSDEDGDILSRLAELEEVRECLRTMEEIEERDRERLLINEE